MPKDLFTTTIKNHRDVIEGLDRLISDFPDITVSALSAQQEVISRKIRANWISIAGGKNGDYVYDSIGQSTKQGKNGSDAVGMTGVFDIDAVSIGHGRVNIEGKRKPINAAQIAYWVEFGTSRLQAGRKLKNATYEETELITVSPRPFISNAFYSTIEDQQKAFINEFSKRLTK